MRVVFAGTPDVAVSTLEALVASDHDVVAVLTRPDRARGRGRKLTPSPVAVRASELAIPVYRPSSVRTEEFRAELAALEPDCCPVVAYGALIPPEVLAMPPHGWVNLHFSLLPRWRGAAPVQHAIWAGDQVTGATTFTLVRELDAGPIHNTVELAIRPFDTAGELLARLAEVGAELMVRTLDQLADGSATWRSQPTEGITTAGKVSVNDARIDWRGSAAGADRLIRACTPAPGAWTTLGGERFKIHRARPQAGIEASPGTVVIERQQVRVACADGALELAEVQAPGRRALPASDWARGVQSREPLVFE